MEGTSALMKHPGIATILATGGNARLKPLTLRQTGIRSWCRQRTGLCRKTAKLKQAVYDIVMSKSFDNGMICASEQAAIVDKEIYAEFIKEMQSYGVYLVNKKRKPYWKNTFSVLIKPKMKTAQVQNSIQRWLANRLRGLQNKPALKYRKNQYSVSRMCLCGRS